MIELRQEPIADLREHALIPSWFEADSIYDVKACDGGFDMAERALGSPFRKDYDRIEDPLGWAVPLETTQSARISAFSAGDRIGGIVVAVARPGLVSWERRRDVAILWDLRVAPAQRGRSVATTLLGAACRWAVEHACTEMKVETQNTNPGACDFYSRSGFDLHEARPGAYSAFPQELQLIWRKRLDGG